MDDTIKTFWEAMCDELLLAQNLLESADTPFNRRTFVRTSFAAIEGIIFTLKSFALTEMDSSLFSASEMALLREETYSLDGRGRVYTQQKFIPIEANVRFAFAMYGRILRKDYELDCSDHNWQAFKKAVAVRNRIVHPKNPSELEVSDDELSSTRIATHWIIETMIDIVKTRYHEVRNKNILLRSQIAEEKPDEDRAV